MSLIAGTVIAIRCLIDPMNDLRFAVRQLARYPGFAVLAVVILGLGIAGNTLVFSIVNGVYLRPLPFKEAARLVDLDETAPQWQLRYTGIAYPDFCAWRSQNRSFDVMGAFAQRDFNLSGIGLAERVEVMRTSHDLLDVLGLRPIAGRGFTQEEDQPGGSRVAMLGHGAWKRLFGGRTDAVGREVQLDGEPFTIVGILPPEAAFPRRDDFWVPLALSPTDSNGWYLRGIGRLKAGITMHQARADLLRIHKGGIDARKVNEITSPVIARLDERYLGDSKPMAAVLIGMEALVLIIACANIAALMLARGMARSKETGVRLALGARPMHMVRQILTECVLLSLAGGIVGVLLGKWIFKTFLAWLPDHLPVWVTLQSDWRFILFVTALTLLTSVLFGALPAIQACSNSNLQGMLAAAGSRLSRSTGQRRSLNSLIIGEVALALVLLSTASLLARTFVKLQQTDPGFRPENVLTYRVTLPESGYPSAQRRYEFFSDHLERVRSLPGITSASAVSAPPLGGHWGTFYEAEDSPRNPPGTPNPVVLNRIVFPDYFETMGIRVMAGRTFNDQDGRNNGRPVVIVNQIIADLYWPGREPLGKRIRQSENAPWYQVVGVVKDVKHYGVSEPMRPGVYLPFLQYDQSSMAIVARTTVEPYTVLPAARALVERADASLALHEASTMTDRLRESLWLRRLVFRMTSVMAGVALVLALGGIYGVISYTAAQRTSEMGIRLALGAQSADIIRLVLVQAAWLVGAGVGIGLIAALALAPALGTLLFGVSPFDPIAMVVIPLLLTGITLLACYVPARRATKIDPIRTLRAD